MNCPHNTAAARPGRVSSTAERSRSDGRANHVTAESIGNHSGGSDTRHGTGNSADTGRPGVVSTIVANTGAVGTAVTGPEAGSVESVFTLQAKYDVGAGSNMPGDLTFVCGRCRLLQRAYCL